VLLPEPIVPYEKRSTAIAGEVTPL